MVVSHERENVERDSTDFFARPILVKNVVQWLSTFTQTCFRILAPIRLVTVVCNLSIWEKIWQKISKSQYFRSVGRCWGSITQTWRLGNFALR